MYRGISARLDSNFILIIGFFINFLYVSVIFLSAKKIMVHQIAFERCQRATKWQGFPSGKIVQPLFKGSWIPNHLQTCQSQIVWRDLQTLYNSRQKDKRNHKVWSQRKVGPAPHCSICLPIPIGPLCFAHKPIPYADYKSICLLDFTGPMGFYGMNGSTAL